MNTSPTVLVIEDDADVQQLLGSHLRRLGCRVRTADDGETGLADALADPPEVVVIDVMLPGIGGREVIAALHGDPATRGCLVVVTSVLDPDDLDDLAEHALLRKPFSRQDVARVFTDLDRAVRDAPTPAATGLRR